MVKEKYKSFLCVILGIFYSGILAFYINPFGNNRIFVGLILIVPLIVFFRNVVDYLYENLNKFDRKTKAYICLFSAMICFLFLVSFLTFAKYVIPATFVANIIIKTSVYIIIYLCIIIIFIKLLNDNMLMENKKISKKKLVIYSIPSFLTGFYYLIAFYPGVMTSDSIGQWAQMITGKYGDHHPVIDTWFNYMITRIWYSPAAVAVAQIMIISIVWGYCMYRFESVGVNKRLLLILTIVFSFNPASSIMIITLWKDILFAVLMLLFTMNVISVLFSDGNWINRKGNKVIFFISSLGIILFRHNGIVPYIGTMIIMMIFFRKKIKPFILSFVIVILSFCLIKGPIFALAHVEKGSTIEMLAIPIQQVAAVVKNNGDLNKKQVEKINKIMPITAWKQNYRVDNVDYIKFNNKFKKDVILSDKKDFFKLWIDVCIQNPKIVLKAYALQTGTVWSMHGFTNMGSRSIYENEYGLKQSTINSTTTKVANKILDISQKKSIKKLFWKPAFQMLLMIFAMFIGIIRNGKKSILVICPIFLNSLTLMMATPAQDFRYLYSNALVYIIVILFSFVKINNKKIY